MSAAVLNFTEKASHAADWGRARTMLDGNLELLVPFSNSWVKTKGQKPRSVNVMWYTGLALGTEREH